MSAFRRWIASAIATLIVVWSAAPASAQHTQAPASHGAGPQAPAKPPVAAKAAPPAVEAKTAPAHGADAKAPAASIAPNLKPSLGVVAAPKGAHEKPRESAPEKAPEKPSAETSAKPPETTAAATAAHAAPAKPAAPAKGSARGTSAVNAAVARIKQRLDIEITPTTGGESRGPAGSPHAAQAPARTVAIPAPADRRTASTDGNTPAPGRVRLSWRQPLEWPRELTFEDLTDQPSRTGR